MALAAVVARCIDQWTGEGIALAPPVAEIEVYRLWRQLDRDLSADVVELYTLLGGFQEYVPDQEFTWSLWPWSMLAQRNAGADRQGVMFCDHSIEVVTWELRYKDPEVSSVWTSAGNRTAPTLQAFFEVYLEDPWELLSGT